MTNRRVAEEIMGWHIFDGRWHEWNGNIRVNLGWWVWATHHQFTPTTDLNHAKMAWDKLSEEEKDYVDEYMIDVGPHKRKEDNYLDAGVLCEAMLSAKETT